MPLTKGAVTLQGSSATEKHQIPKIANEPTARCATAQREASGLADRLSIDPFTMPEAPCLSYRLVERHIRAINPPTSGAIGKTV